jgi:hypothetical protein
MSLATISKLTVDGCTVIIAPAAVKDGERVGYHVDGATVVASGDTLEELVGNVTAGVLRVRGAIQVADADPNANVTILPPPERLCPLLPSDLPGRLDEPLLPWDQ